MKAACPSFETWLWVSTSPFQQAWDSSNHFSVPLRVLSFQTSKSSCSCYGLEATASSSAFQPTCLAFRPSWPSVLPAAPRSWGSAAFLLFSPSLALQSAGERWPVALNGSSKAAEAQIWSPTCTSQSFCHLKRCSCCAGQGCIHMAKLCMQWPYSTVHHIPYARITCTYFFFDLSGACCPTKEMSHIHTQPVHRTACRNKADMVHEQPILSHRM